MKDLGTAEFCVGIHISRNSDGSISLDQEKYIEEILAHFGMANSKPIDTPMDANQRLTTGARPADFNPDKIPYQSAVGCLLYLTQGTRPDLAYAVNTASRYNNCLNI